MGYDIKNVKRNMIFKSENSLEFDVVSDRELEDLKRRGRIDTKSIITHYAEDENKVARPIHGTKRFYR